MPTPLWVSRLHKLSVGIPEESEDEEPSNKQSFLL
jgi:hypothetical protein